MTKYKFYLINDFQLNLHVDVEDAENTNGFSFLIALLESIGYYSKSQSVPAGVNGNKNPFYISRKYGDYS